MIEPGGERTSVCWRRIDDVPGLELLALSLEPHRVIADSTLICLDNGGFRLRHVWQLTPDWRALSLRIERHDSRGDRTLSLDREGAGWRVDGQRRPDLDGAEEPDLSATPFCNTFAIRRMPASAGATLTLDVAYVDAADLAVERSRQRYDGRGAGRFRYVDLGLFAGFEADLEVDDLGLVERYEHLFERVRSR